MVDPVVVGVGADVDARGTRSLEAVVANADALREGFSRGLEFFRRRRRRRRRRRGRRGGDRGGRLAPLPPGSRPPVRRAALEGRRDRGGAVVVGCGGGRRRGLLVARNPLVDGGGPGVSAASFPALFSSSRWTGAGAATRDATAGWRGRSARDVARGGTARGGTRARGARVGERTSGGGFAHAFPASGVETTLAWATVTPPPLPGCRASSSAAAAASRSSALTMGSARRRLLGSTARAAWSVGNCRGSRFTGGSRAGAVAARVSRG